MEFASAIARAASFALATAPRERKDAALEKLAELIDASHFELLAANQRDLLSPEAAALSPAVRDRLELNEKRLRHLAASVREVVALPDPVGELLEEIARPNGLRIRKVRVPIGVIGIIYESRPNVTADSAALCLKSGNACVLRGGSEAIHSNTAIAGILSEASEQAGVPSGAITFDPGALPDGACYTITLGSRTFTGPLGGDTDAKVRALSGDATGDGLVNLSDALAIQARIGGDPAASPGFDVDLSGAIDLSDALAAKAAVASPAGQALCP